jgi:hypothetical protein
MKKIEEYLHFYIGCEYRYLQKDGSRENKERCPIELFVEEYFGLSEVVDFNDRTPKLIYADIVNIVAMYVEKKLPTIARKSFEEGRAIIELNPQDPITSADWKWESFKQFWKAFNSEQNDERGVTTKSNGIGKR